MKPMKIFITSWCPHCKNAILWLEDLKKENPNYKDIDLKVIDEELHPEISKNYDYYYVPTYYVGEEKFYEGATTKALLRGALDKAFE